MKQELSCLLHQNEAGIELLLHQNDLLSNQLADSIASVQNMV